MEDILLFLAFAAGTSIHPVTLIPAILLGIFCKNHLIKLLLPILAGGALGYFNYYATRNYSTATEFTVAFIIGTTAIVYIASGVKYLIVSNRQNSLSRDE